MNPRLKLINWDIARPLMQDIVRTANEKSGCRFVSWAKLDDDIQWRGVYANGDDARVGLEDIAPFLSSLTDGPAELTSLEVRATAELWIKRLFSSCCTQPSLPLHEGARAQEGACEGQGP